MDMARAAHLHRIAQEAVYNAITHGRAKRIELGFARHDDHETFTIMDDGTGRRPREDGRQGIGMQMMAFRARIIGASLEVTPRPPVKRSLHHPCFSAGVTAPVQSLAPYSEPPKRNVRCFAGLRFGRIVDVTTDKTCEFREVVEAVIEQAMDDLEIHV
jgi:hypothetical protein